MIREANRLSAVLATVAISFGTAWATEKPAPQPVGGTIEWVFDYEEGKKLSAATGKPMFVVFRCEK